MERGHVPLKHKVAVVAVAALFMDLLDLTIINVALPSIEADLDASATQLQWTVTAYLLVLAITMSASGWLTDAFGGKRVFTAAVAVFTAASATAAASPTIETLIAARAVQGIGGGLLVPVGMALLFRAYPENERERASATFAVPAAVAPAIGPFLGGLLVDSAGWRWVFIINVPVGVLAAVLCVVWLPRSDVRRETRFDLRGFVSGALGLVAVMWALSRIGDAGQVGVSSGVALAASLLVVGLFVRHEGRVRKPLLDVALFRYRTFSLGHITMFLASAGFGGLLFSLPSFLQGPGELSALTAGTVMGAHAVGILVATPLSGRLVTRAGAWRVLGTGVVGSGAATIAFVALDTGSPRWAFAGLLLVAGLFFGLMIVPLQTIPFTELADDDIAQGTAILGIVRQLGVAFGTCFAAVPIALSNEPSGFRVAFLVAGALALAGAASTAPSLRRTASITQERSSV
jgi:EmrB/QacA subfamily drug resistance transporter